MTASTDSSSNGWAELCWVFLKLGCTAFGGPAAHIGLMEAELVRRRAWLNHEEFLDLLSATNLIPGPNSTEMAIHIGWRRGGWPGLMIAGVAFILPAALLVTAIASVYVRFGRLPQMANLLYGVKPVMIAVVVQALWGLGRTALKTRVLAGLGLTVILFNLLGVHELVVLFGAGVLAAMPRSDLWRGCQTTFRSLPLLAAAKLSALPLLPVSSVAAPYTLSGLFFFFLKIGSVLFGSGYVLLAFLRADLVERYHWLTQEQLLDAVAVGQVTPGPLFTSATFIGFVLGGPRAAFLATVGIFLPAFLFVAASGPIIPRLRSSRLASGFLDGVNVASLALMGVVTWQLGAAALVDWMSVFLAILAGALLLRFQINSAWLVLGGAAIGLSKSLWPH